MFYRLPFVTAATTTATNAIIKSFVFFSSYCVHFFFVRHSTFSTSSSSYKTLKLIFPTCCLNERWAYGWRLFFFSEGAWAFAHIYASKKVIIKFEKEREKIVFFFSSASAKDVTLNLRKICRVQCFVLTSTLAAIAAACLPACKCYFLHLPSFISVIFTALLYRFL